jgi:hypothetical protein
MSTEIAGVKLLAVAYAWSHRGVSFFISTIGDTAAGAEPYTSCFEDEYGLVGSVDIPRPEFASFINDMLPCIDEHIEQAAAAFS